MTIAFSILDSYEIFFFFIALFLLAGIAIATFVYYSSYKKLKDQLNELTKQRNELLKQLIEKKSG